MDLSNYEQITALIRKLCRGMSPDDQDDFIQDVLVKLIRAGDGKVTKAMIRRAVKQIKIDKHRKEQRAPRVVYDNEIVEKYSHDV